MERMKFVAGVDIGNATTEVAIARIEGQDIQFLASGIGPTTGIKGTLKNINGVFMSLNNALKKVGLEYSDLDEIRINEAAPVIGDVAMEINDNNGTPFVVGLRLKQAWQEARGGEPA